ncbi:MAG: hypothetical protein Ct9H300mP30_3930 [Methanobacteriota archaeon]|nr:MAG: hypothetical protein Ct9H300mP30_3930 [Euryarchaeota archaeon]
MAFPGHDQRDYDFAERYGIEIRRVLVESEGDDPAAQMTRRSRARADGQPRVDGFEGRPGGRQGRCDCPSSQPEPARGQSSTG